MRYIFVFIFLLGMIVGCNHATSTSSGNDTHDAPAKAPLTGVELYQANCVSCHGAAGNLGSSGAKNLQLSTLDKTAVIQQVTNGKGMMSSFKGVLSTDEIDRVADYVLTLRK